jgi:hypothetical protein
MFHLSNTIRLIGSVIEGPEPLYEPTGAELFWMKMKVPLPADAAPTYWYLVYDVRCGQHFTRGDETFLVICRDPLLFERWACSLKRGDVVCVEGRLVLTELRCDGDLVPLAEILAETMNLLSDSSSL